MSDPHSQGLQEEGIGGWPGLGTLSEQHDQTACPIVHAGQDQHLHDGRKTRRSDLRHLEGLSSIGGVLVAAFVAYQLHLQKSDRPLLDLRTLKQKTFTVSLLLMSAAFMALTDPLLRARAPRQRWHLAVQ